MNQHLHPRFLHLHPHAFVEVQGCVVALPHVERDVAATDRTGEVAHKLEEGLSDVSAARLLIDADVVDIQRLDVLQQAVVPHLDELAEGVSEHLSVVIDEDGLVVVVEDGLKLFFVVFGRVGLEKVGANCVVYGIDLIQQCHQALDVSFFGFSDYGTLVVVGFRLHFH